MSSCTYTACRCEVLALVYNCELPFSISDRCQVQEINNSQTYYTLSTVVTVFQPSRDDLYIGNLTCVIDLVFLTARWQKPIGLGFYHGMLFKGQLLLGTSPSTISSYSETTPNTINRVTFDTGTSGPSRKSNGLTAVVALGSAVPILVLFVVIAVIAAVIVRRRKRSRKRTALSVQPAAMLTPHTTSNRRQLPATPNPVNHGEQEEYDIIGEQYYSTVYDRERKSSYNMEPPKWGVNSRSEDVTGYVFSCQHEEPNYADINTREPEQYSVTQTDNPMIDRVVYVENPQIAYSVP